MQRLNENDLDWLAFRYISNEMTPPEAESFEWLLADDQAAREAVARAVDLAQAVACVPADVIPIATTHHSPLTTHSRRRARPIRWIAAAAAVLVGSIFIFQSFHNSSELKALAKVWAKRLGQEAFDLNDPALLAESEDPMSLDDENDLTVPSWMIEAVGGGSDSDKWDDS